MAVEEMTLQEIVDQLDKCDYTADNGLHLLDMNRAFKQLVEKAKDEGKRLQKMRNLLKDVEVQEFRCLTGKLCNCMPFMELKDMVKPD